MALDSADTFDERVKPRHLTACAERFRQANWHTFADLAFATSFSPGGDKTVFTGEIIVKGLGSADHADRPRLRRLFWEAFTLASADMRAQVSKGPDDVPRVIPNAEREARRARVVARLTGLEVEEDPNLDVSDKLIDRCIHMSDSNRLAYLGPALCTKRSMELCGVNSDPLWASQPDMAGVMRLKKMESDDCVILDDQIALMYKCDCRYQKNDK